VPAVSGSTALVVAAAVAAAVGFGAASIMAAVRGERLEETTLGRRRGVALFVAMGYLAVAAIIIYTIVDASR